MENPIIAEIVAILKASNRDNFELPDEWETAELMDLCGYPSDFLQRAKNKFGVGFKREDLYLTITELAKRIISAGRK